MTEVWEKAVLTVQQRIAVYKKYLKNHPDPEILPSPLAETSYLKAQLEAQAKAAYEAGQKDERERCLQAAQDYFNLSWGEHSKKYPQVARSKVPGEELIEIVSKGIKPNSKSGG